MVKIEAQVFKMKKTKQKKKKKTRAANQTKRFELHSSIKNIEDLLPGFMIRNKYKRSLVKSFKNYELSSHRPAVFRLTCCLYPLKTAGQSVESSWFLKLFTRERLYLFRTF